MGRKKPNNAMTSMVFHSNIYQLPLVNKKNHSDPLLADINGMITFASACNGLSPPY